MSRTGALAFTFKRGDDVVNLTEIRSTSEVVHGLLRLDGEKLVIQWRTSRSTDRVGVTTIRTEHEVEPVRELELPLSAIAGAEVRRLWWRWPPGLHLVLTAADLRAFEEVAGENGLKLKHPAELAIRIRRSTRMAAQQFASEIELALADRALRLAEGSSADPGSRVEGRGASVGDLPAPGPVGRAPDRAESGR